SQRKRRSRVIIQVEQPIGKLVQCEPDIAKSICQSFENILEFAATRDGVRGNKLEIRAANLLVKLDIWSAPQTSVLSRDCGMKNPANEQRIIADVRPEQERLLGSGAVQRDQNVGDILFGQMMSLVRDPQPARVRKCFQQRRDIIAKLAVADPTPSQNVASKHVKIKMR